MVVFETPNWFHVKSVSQEYSIQLEFDFLWWIQICRVMYLFKSLRWRKLLSQDTHLTFLWPWWTDRTCLVRFSTVAKVSWQILHGNSIFSWFLLTWFSSWDFLANPSPHMLHTKFLSPSWTVWMCLANEKLEPNPLPQVSHGIIAILSDQIAFVYIFRRTEICFVLDIDWEFVLVTNDRVTRHCESWWKIVHEFFCEFNFTNFLWIQFHEFSVNSISRIFCDFN